MELLANHLAFYLHSHYIFDAHSSQLLKWWARTISASLAPSSYLYSEDSCETLCSVCDSDRSCQAGSKHMQVPRHPRLVQYWLSIVGRPRCRYCLGSMACWACLDTQRHSAKHARTQHCFSWPCSYQDRCKWRRWSWIWCKHFLLSVEGGMRWWFAT